MTAPISSIVAVSIASGTANPTQQGFGTAGITSHTATWPERSRTYADLTEVAADFAATTPEYLAAQAHFSANPRPKTLKILRANDAVPTQRWAITPVAVNSKVYSLEVDGQVVSFTSDGSATVAEIIAGLKAAIDALALALTTSDQTTYLRVVANVAGAFHSIGTYLEGSARNDPNLGVAQDHADPGIATALNNILAADSDWYGLITTFNSKALVDAAAAWAEANGRLYVVQTQDTATINTALSGTDDVMESTKSAGYTHTGVIFSNNTKDFADAAWQGKRLVDSPGTNTWCFAPLAGVPAGNYSSTQLANVLAKYGNLYQPIANVANVQNGRTASGLFIDFVIYKDFLVARLGERIFGLLVNAKKVGYDDAGIDMIRTVIEARLQTDADAGILQKGTWYVTVPKSSDIPAGDPDRLARLLEGVKFYAEYVGGIQKVNIAGVLVPG